MKSVALVALLSSCVLGCSVEGTVFHADVAFTAVERASVEEGAALISDKTGRVIDVVFDLPHDAPEQNFTIRRERPGKDVGYYDGATHIQLDADAMRGPFLALLTAHELGHFLRMAHHSGPGIMSGEGTRESDTWNDADEAECRRVSACR